MPDDFVYGTYTRTYIYTHVKIYICMYVHTYKYIYFMSLYIYLDMSGQFTVITQNRSGNAESLCCPCVHSHPFH